MSALKNVDSRLAETQLTAGASKVALARARARAGTTALVAAPSTTGAGAGPLAGRVVERGVTRLLGRAANQVVAHSRYVPGPAAPAPGSEKVAGKILRILFGSDQTEKGMLLVQGEGSEPFKLQGALTFKPEAGMRVSANAVLEVHPKYGRQYNAELVVQELPVDRAGAVAYMARAFEGAGKPLVTRIYDAFGETTFDVIQHTPERLLAVDGIDARGVASISACWELDSAARNIWSYLGGHGITDSVAAKIYSRFGADTWKVTKKESYRLATVDGVDFMTVDRIAAECGVQADPDARVVGVIEYVLEKAAQQGNTAISSAEMVSEVQRLAELGGADQAALIQAAVDFQVQKGLLVVRALDGAQCLTTAAVSRAESSIAQKIKALVDAGGSNEVLAAKAREKAESLNDESQADAVANVFECPVSVITGGPGCGKTTVIKVIADVARDAGLHVVMAAPTGKAARRMAEATSRSAETVHSILKPMFGAGPDSFQHDADNLLSGDLFVIDESSMMDTAITMAYLAAIPPGSRVVFVGDADQLPSVGAGNVLRDIIASGKVPVACLETVHRTALGSDIVVNAHRVRRGEASQLDMKGSKDFKFVAALDDQSMKEVTLKKYLQMVSKYGVDGVQVLVARRGTPVGVEAMNELLRPAVNPACASKPELEHRGVVFRLGDRVMRTSNNKNLGVSNGEVGVISELDAKARRICINFGGRVVPHQAGELNALQLAYATTIHKSQGSEYGGVITLVPNSHRSMLSRNLIYTAMTRGKKESDIVGDPSALRAAIGRLGASRCTGLVQEICGAFDGAVHSAHLHDAMTTKTLVKGPSKASSTQTSTEPEKRPAAPTSQPAALPTKSERAPMFRRPRL